MLKSIFLWYSYLCLLAFCIDIVVTEDVLLEASTDAVEYDTKGYTMSHTVTLPPFSLDFETTKPVHNTNFVYRVGRALEDFAIGLLRQERAAPFSKAVNPSRAIKPGNQQTGPIRNG